MASANNVSQEIAVTDRINLLIADMRENAACKPYAYNEVYGPHRVHLCTCQGAPFLSYHIGADLTVCLWGDLFARFNSFGEVEIEGPNGSILIRREVAENLF